MQRDIRCPHCDTLFGKEITAKQDPDNPILTIKNRDLYRSYKGGRVWGPCRGCVATIVWPEEYDDTGPR